MKRKILNSVFVFSMILIMILPAAVCAESTPSSWASEEVEKAKDDGLVTESIMRNYGADITREQFCEIAVKVYEKISGKSAETGSTYFSDTNNSEILKAANLGIVTGYSGGFHPNELITREQIAAMLVRAVEAAAVPDDNLYKNNYFSDSDEISDWASSSVNFAYNSGFMRGTGSNCISPQANTTCEQAVLLAYRACQSFGGSDSAADCSEYIGKWSWENSEPLSMNPEENWYTYHEVWVKLISVDGNKARLEYYNQKGGVHACYYDICTGDIDGSVITAYADARKSDDSPVLGQYRLTLKFSGDRMDFEAFNVSRNNSEFSGVFYKEPADTDWQRAYRDYIARTDIHARYNFIYIDNDDIPELYMVGDSTAQGDMLCVYNPQTSYVTAKRMYNYSLSYIPKSGYFIESGGRMDEYFDYIYKIENGEIKYIHKGEFGAEDNSNVQYDEFDEPMYMYFWDGKNVARYEYDKLLAEAYDASKSVSIEEGEGYDFSDIMDRN